MRPTKLYIASRLANAANVRNLGARLVSEGCKITYDWTRHGSVEREPHRWAEVAVAEVQGVMNADILVALLPGGNGTHVELGLALGTGIPILLVFTEKEDLTYPSGYPCVFHHHPMVFTMCLPGLSGTDNQREMAIGEICKAVKSCGSRGQLVPREVSAL
jgi:hypothetical protein